MNKTVGKSEKMWEGSTLWLALALWCLMRTAPYFLVGNFLQEYLLHHQYKGTGYLLVVALILPLIWSLEFLWISTGFLAARRVRARLIRMPLLLLWGGLVVSYFSLLLVSWFYYSAMGLFLDKQALQLSVFLLDTKTLMGSLGDADMLWIFALFATSLLLTGGYFKISSRISARLIQLRSLLLIVTLSVVVLLLPRLCFSSIEKELQNHLHPILGNFSSPELSLFIAPLWFESGSKRSESITLSDLSPQYSLQSYRTRVTENSKKKSVVVILIEALRRDALAMYGGDPEIMPFLSSLESSVVTFDRVFAQAPETGYSKTAVFSGLYPLKYPYRDIGRDVSYPNTRIYDVLSTVGYKTALFDHYWDTTVPLLESPHLDLFFEPTRPSTFQGVPVAPAEVDGAGIPKLESIDRQNVAAFKHWTGSLDRSQPFFAGMYLCSSHFPFTVEDPSAARFEPWKIEHAKDRVSYLHFSERDMPLMRNRYWNTLGNIDRMIEEIFRHLSRHNRLSETLVIITGDHGTLFGEHDEVGHGGRLYNEVIQVPLVMYGLNQASTTRVDKLSAHIDVAPTIVDALQLPHHDNFQGESMLAEEKSDARAIYSTVQLAIHEDCIIEESYKYCVDDRTKVERLFNLKTDPMELVELSSSEKEVAARLAKDLAKFRDSQFSYYSSRNSYRDRFFPPKY